MFIHVYKSVYMCTSVQIHEKWSSDDECHLIKGAITGYKNNNIYQIYMLKAYCSSPALALALAHLSKREDSGLILVDFAVGLA